MPALQPSPVRRIGADPRDAVPEMRSENKVAINGCGLNGLLKCTTKNQTQMRSLWERDIIAAERRKKANKEKQRRQSIL
jgi:hypothetical protein